MDKEYARLIVALAEFSLDQAATQSMAIRMITGWLQNVDTAQAIRDDIADRVQEGVDETLLKKHEAQLREMNKRNRDAMEPLIKYMENAIARSESARDQIAAAIESLKVSLKS